MMPSLRQLRRSDRSTATAPAPTTISGEPVTTPLPASARSARAAAQISSLPTLSLSEQTQSSNARCGDRSRGGSSQPPPSSYFLQRLFDSWKGRPNQSKEDDKDNLGSSNGDRRGSEETCPEEDDDDDNDDGRGEGGQNEGDTSCVAVRHLGYDKDTPTAAISRRRSSLRRPSSSTPSTSSKDVTFHPGVRSHTIPNLDSMPSSQRTQLYYDAVEYALLQENIREDIRHYRTRRRQRRRRDSFAAEVALASGNIRECPDEEEEEDGGGAQSCARGIEHYLAPCTHREARMGAAEDHVVQMLHQQHHLRTLQLAARSRDLSGSAVHLARETGARDEAYIRRVWGLPPLQPDPSPSSSPPPQEQEQQQQQESVSAATNKDTVGSASCPLPPLAADVSHEERARCA
eukprot:CAMPEP_0185800686 /NCGR_PEP_ID=MMETSP1322-20130828/1017_1 /TAXON_ID=265543 /ORGANISM="Minutocellus polymorphus, Strain RCC2270" /LENGTH=402 /DNA_ID=CAMNT_0028496339 /DNA_START=196 /DNA_END=1404 /DNA_ORIENTATION=+